LVRRFISADQDAVWCRPGSRSDSSQILPVVEKLDHALDTVRTQHPGYEIAVTGLSAIAARNSASMIEKPNQQADVSSSFLVRVFHRVAFRSVVVMLSCILPGIFPVVLSGHGAVACRAGLQFAASVASPLSFGLG